MIKRGLLLLVLFGALAAAPVLVAAQGMFGIPGEPISPVFRPLRFYVGWMESSPQTSFVLDVPKATPVFFGG